MLSRASEEQWGGPEELKMVPSQQTRIQEKLSKVVSVCGQKKMVAFDAKQTWVDLPAPSSTGCGTWRAIYPLRVMATSPGQWVTATKDCHEAEIT